MSDNEKWDDYVRQGVPKRKSVIVPSADSGIPITVTQPDDPAYKLLQDGHTSTPTVYRRGCYICEDPEFAQMGLPLCRPCPKCSEGKDEPAGHIPADDETCDECGFNEREAYEEEYARACREARIRGMAPPSIEHASIFLKDVDAGLAGPPTKPDPED